MNKSISKILMFMSFFIQAYGGSVNENEDDSVTPIGRYHFNHPPIVEEYDPILESLKYNEDTDNKPRKFREVDNSEDDLVINENTAETEQYKTSLGDEQVNKKNESESNTQIETTTVKNEDKVILRKKNGVRKTKVQKRIIQKAVTNENNFTSNNNVPKQITRTTTLKPIKTTFKPTENPKVSANEEFVKRSESRQKDPVVPIVESENFVYGDKGNFHYSYVSGDGSKASEEGTLKVFDDKSTGEAVVGSFSYTDKEGNDFSLSYTADENGYRPVGDHLPTPPPIPPAIARALQYLATKTPTESTTKS